MTMKPCNRYGHLRVMLNLMLKQERSSAEHLSPKKQLHAHSGPCITAQETWVPGWGMLTLRGPSGAPLAGRGWAQGSPSSLMCVAPFLPSACNSAIIITLWLADSSPVIRVCACLCMSKQLSIEPAYRLMLEPCVMCLSL